MSGRSAANQENQLQLITIEFMVHAKNRTTLGGIRETGKEIAQRLVERIAEAFDPDNPLPITDDAWALTVRGEDGSIREGDREWAWLIQYDITIDAEYFVAPPE